MEEQGVEHSGQRETSMCEDPRWNRAWKEPKETGNGVKQTREPVLSNESGGGVGRKELRRIKKVKMKGKIRTKT